MNESVGKMWIQKQEKVFTAQHFKPQEKAVQLLLRWMNKRKLPDPCMGGNSGKVPLCWGTLQSLQAPLLLRVSCQCFKPPNLKVCCRCSSGQLVTLAFLCIFDEGLLFSVSWLKDVLDSLVTHMWKQYFEMRSVFHWQSTKWKILIDLSDKVPRSSSPIIQA